MSTRLRETLLFLVGCPRSGTTWLQLLLYQHPLLATSQETHLFSRYLARVLADWNKDCQSGESRRIGLPAVLTEWEFQESLRDFCESVWQRIRCSKDTPRVILEKTPDHMLYWREIHRLYPDAGFLVVHRDPRSVTASLLRASSDWGSAWAPTNAIDAARVWRKYYDESQELLKTVKNSHAVRYEDLLTDGEEIVKHIFDWLGLKVSSEDAAEIYRRCQFENLENRSDVIQAPWDLAAEPQKFYRSGTADDWRVVLTPLQTAIVESITGSGMQDLCYQPSARRYRTAQCIIRSRDIVESITRSFLVGFARIFPSGTRLVMNVAKSTLARNRP